MRNASRFAPVLMSSTDMLAECNKVIAEAKAIEEAKAKKAKKAKGEKAGRQSTVDAASRDAALAILARHDWDIFDAATGNKGLSLKQLTQLAMYKGVYEAGATNKMKLVKLLKGDALFDDDKTAAAANAATQAEAASDDDDDVDDDEEEDGGDDDGGDDDDDSDDSDDDDDDSDDD